ncbi:MAG: GHKL domain-containing protein [Bacteroides sp.]|nr:GHKL domain-containing protein [Bacteroides sp.]MCM1548791.1 GHKL domain-containing protein [Clostridium sp.]
MKQVWLSWGASLLFLAIRAGYAYALARFCGIQMEASKKKRIITGVLIFIERLIVEVCYESYSIPYIIYSFICNALIFVLVLLLFPGGWEKKLLTVAVTIIIEKLAGSFSVSFFSCLVLLSAGLFGKDADILFTPWFSEFLGILGLGVVMGIIYGLTGPFRKLLFHKPKKWFLALAVPLLFMIGIIDVVNWGASNGIVVVAGVIGTEYGRLERNAFFSHLAICLITLLLICMAAGYILGMERLYTEQQRKEQYRFQVDSYKMLEEQYRQMERLRHDMKNHLLGLQGLWENQEWEKLGHYLGDMLSAGDITGREAVSGSKAVDAVLYRKRKQAEQAHIAWECEVQLSHDCKIAEFDICVLLGNILDNALEACEQLPEDTDRYIRLRLCTIKKYLLLEVKNSTDRKNIGEIGYTQKESPEEHGFGLLNIYETAKKYNGVVNREIQGHEFEISVLLPFEETVCDSKGTV